MNKKLILLFSSALLLTACGSTTTSIEDKTTSDTKTDSLTSENSKAESSDSVKTSETSLISEDTEFSESSTFSEVESSELSEESSIDENKTTKTFIFKNSEMPTGDLTKSSTSDAFLNWLNADEVIFSSIVVNGYCQNYTNNEGEVRKTLLIGSRNDEGSIEFKLSESLKNIDIQLDIYVQAYHKEYSISGDSYLNVDTTAHLYVDDDKNFIDLSSDGSKVPEVVKKTYNIKDSFRFYNYLDAKNVPDKEGQRAFIHQISLTY